MPRSKWVYLYEMMNKCKGHIVHPDLAEALAVELKHRYGLTPDPDHPTAEHGWYDLGGMVHMEEPVLEVQLSDGYEFHLYAKDYSALVARLTGLSTREFANGQKYYKVHGWMHCTVMTPAQGEELQAKLQELEHVAVAAETETVARMEAVRRDMVDKGLMAAPPPAVLTPGPDSDDWN